ncbi:MAG: DUF2336 domain-containing protein [Pseudomonadota bacterium]
MIETSASVAPLLVRLYDFQRSALSDAAALSPDMYGEITDAATSLINTKLADRDRDLVTDALLTLIQQAEMDLRQAMAERLAVMDNVPIRLILKLAHDDVCVARDILRLSPALNDLDLLYILKSQDAAYWRHIAARHRMGPLVIDALADTRDIDTMMTLAENTHITLTQHAFKTIGSVAHDDTRLATPLLSRREVPADLARALYTYVGQKLQSHLQVQFGFVEADLNQTVSDAVQDVTHSSRMAGILPSTAMMRAAFVFDSRGQLSGEVMLKTLARGQLASFVAMLSVKANIAPQTVLTMLQPDGFEGLVVVCCALSFTKNEFMQIYILTQKVRSVDGRINQQQLHRALLYFDTLTQAKAKTLLASTHATSA